jgi:hypothetical protein
MAVQHAITLESLADSEGNRVSLLFENGLPQIYFPVIIIDLEL